MAMVKVTVSNNVKRETNIIPDSTTLRTALENAEIDYSRGMVNLDGSPLQPGDLDKTFADFGIAEKCFLSSIVKADNAAGITVAGQAVVITSSMTLDNIKTIGKYRPNALQLKDAENKEVIFSVGIAKGKGSINKYGAEFDGVTYNSEGKAVITLDMPEVKGNVAESIAEYVGVAILNLNKLEAQLPAVINEIATEKAAIMANINVQ